MDGDVDVVLVWICEDFCWWWSAVRELAGREDLSWDGQTKHQHGKLAGKQI